MRATVLAYGCEGRELDILKTVCARLGLRARRVVPAEYGRPVGAFFGLANAGESAASAGDIPGRMLVLAGLTDRQREALLTALRTARAGDSLKAVLTEYNASWTGPVLYAALAEEHRQMSAPR